MSTEGLASFKLAVLSDRRLQAELLAVPERSPFVAAVVARARAGGFEVEPADVEEALGAARHAWNLRWV